MDMQDMMRATLAVHSTLDIIAMSGEDVVKVSHVSMDLDKTYESIHADVWLTVNLDYITEDGIARFFPPDAIRDYECIHHPEFTFYQYEHRLTLVNGIVVIANLTTPLDNTEFLRLTKAREVCALCGCADCENCPMLDFT